MNIFCKIPLICRTEAREICLVWSWSVFPRAGGLVDALGAGHRVVKVKLNGWDHGKGKEGCPESVPSAVPLTCCRRTDWY